MIKAEVFCGGIFSHASKSDNSDGLEFASRNLNDVSGDLNDVSGDLNDVSGDSNDATLKKTEIFNLPILPWNRKNGFLILCGCNTGLLGKRGWCPAKAFSIRQKIIVLGQKGYAYFSKNWNKYEMIDINNREVYLWAYKRRRNDFMGGIQEPAIRIEAAIFKGNML